ncbi:MAG: type II toxin-antitoxin system PemK/MazF family toxin [Eubacteriales bacterium]
MAIDLCGELRRLITRLEELIQYAGNYHIEETKIVYAFIKHLQNKTEMFIDEEIFQIPDGIVIKRGMVFWVNFGVNIGQEFGGKHPAIVLKVGGKTAIVAPLSSQEPTEKQKNSGTYIEVDKVHGLKNIKRWCNVLNTMPVSLQRFDFNSSTGNVKGYVLDRLNEGIKKSCVWERKPIRIEEKTGSE